MTALKILYVEDEPNMRMMVRMALESIGGFTVRECETGRAAIDLAQSGDFAPDLIFLDFQLPDMNGDETLVALRKIPATARIPVIVMSGEDRPEDQEKFNAMGAIGILDKTMDLFELPGEIARLMETHDKQ